MEIRYFISYWGNEDIPLVEFLKQAKEAGFQEIEMKIPLKKDFAVQIKHLLAEYQLELIAQQWLSPETETINSHISRMDKNLRYLSSFQPLFINSHTGKDFYTFQENCKILEAAENISKESGVMICHETHRGRCLYSAPMARLYFAEFPGMKITADFSHWCCVSESLLEGQEALLDEAIKRAGYIHARVGYPQGPQVNHPFAPKNSGALKAHVGWWQQIIDYQKKIGTKVFPVLVEFGPIPYLQSLPFTDQPVVDLWKINIEMMHYLKQQLKA
jgi:hypothetical protein